MHWRIASGTIDLKRPVFLGILNVTPDSFSDGGLHMTPQAAVEQARSLAADGAALLDLGAESTRPGAAPVSLEEEWSRLAPVLDGLAVALPGACLSLDTRHAGTARQGLAKGVAVLNDVTGFSDPALLDLAHTAPSGLIAMRSRVRDGRLVMPEYGGPGETNARAAIAELKAIRDRLLQAGIAPDRILLDPGFGFGTTFAEDRALWEALPDLPETLGWPVQRFCIGISRKRFLAWRAGAKDLPPARRDDLTREAHAEATAWGYRVFRTHRI